MNNALRGSIKNYLVDYVRLKKPDIKITGNKLFRCLFEHEHEIKSDRPSCNIYPPNSGQLFCFSPEHQKIGDIFSVVRKLEEDKANWSDDAIGDYLIDLFKIQTDDKVEKALMFYQISGWDLVPVAKGAKNPIEKSWPEKTHKNIIEWQDWLQGSNLNVGVKCGKVSNITVIDVDLHGAEFPKDVQELIGETLTQTTKNGKHFFFAYDPELPKTNFDLDDKIHIDVQNDGSQVVIFPSVVDGVGREFNDSPICAMPKELKDWLLKYIKPVNKEENNIPDFAEIKISGLTGCCNNTFLKLGGILRKTFTTKQTTDVLFLFNSLLEQPMPAKDIMAMSRSLDKYDLTDKNDLTNKVLAHLDLVQEATSRDLKDSLGFGKAEIEQCLANLLREQKIYKTGRLYRKINKVEFRDTFIGESKKIDFKMPYFEDIATFRNGDMLIIGAKTGEGKCFGKGTKILMSDGKFKNVELIKISDKVMGTDSNPRNVLNTHSGTDTLYEIIPDRGDKFIVNSNHILSLKKTGTEEVINISVKDYLKTNKTFKHIWKLYRLGINFQKQEVPLEPYWLGLWLGDGDSRDSRITNIDCAVIRYIKQYAKRLKLKFTKYIYNGRVGSYKMSSGQGNWQNKYNVKSDLIKLDLLQNKHIPDIYKYNSEEVRLQILAGLLDSDGYLCNNAFTITTKFFQLAEDIKFLAQSLGFYVSIKDKKVRKYPNNKYYNLYISSNHNKIPCKILRKQISNRLKRTNPLLTGFKIKELNKGKYYGFELDGNHLHFIQDFFVQHNSHVAMNIIKQLVAQGKKPNYLSLEAGNRFTTIALQLGLSEGSFNWANCYRPETIELEDNAISIIDWLLPDVYADSDKLFKRFSEQLDKHGGIAIIFVQLRTDGEFFAKNLIDFFPAAVFKFRHPNPNDRESAIFESQKLRESKSKLQYVTIPLKYNFETKLLELKNDTKKEEAKS